MTKPAEAAATEICDWCGIDQNDAERVAAIIDRHFPPVTLFHNAEKLARALEEVAIPTLCYWCDCACHKWDEQNPAEHARALIVKRVRDEIRRQYEFGAKYNIIRAEWGEFDLIPIIESMSLEEE